MEQKFLVRLKFCTLKNIYDDENLSGRPMAIDWSLPKNVYQQMQKTSLIRRKIDDFQDPPKEIQQATGYGIQTKRTVDIPEIKEEEEEMEVDEESDDEQAVEEEPKQSDSLIDI